jgi:hypothetical protein
MAAETTEKILAQESGHLGHNQPDFQIAKTTRPTIESARIPITTRAHRAPRMRKTLAMTPNRYTGMAIGCIPKSDDMSCPVVNFHNQRTRMKEKSANHRMPSMRCVFINAKSPNVPAQRPRGKKAPHGTETSSRGSLQPILFGDELRYLAISLRSICNRNQVVAHTARLPNGRS